MDFKFTAEQMDLVSRFKKFCAENVSEEAVWGWYKNNDVPSEIFMKYLADGFGLLGLPEEHGGVPASKSTICVLVEEMAHATGASMPFMTNSLVMFDICEFGNSEQVKWAIDQFKTTGRSPCSLAISEPSAGSDNGSMLTYAKSIGDGKYLLNGSKTFVTNGFYFPYTLVVAKDENNDAANRDMSIWMIPVDREGVSMSPLRKIGQTTMPFAKLELKDVVVQESELLGEKGKGFINLMKNFEFERCVISAHSLGLAKACMDDAANYAAERVAFGKTITKYQMIQEMLTEMELKIRNMELMTYNVLWKLDNNMPVQLDSALLKRYVPRTAVEVCSDALQILGGIGYTEDARVGRMWNDARGNQMAGGTDEIMVYIAGRQVVKKYTKGFEREFI